VLLADIYPAGERKMAGVNSGLILEAARDHGHSAIHYVGDIKSACDSLAQHVRASDVVITLGAGDVWKVGVDFLERSRSNVNSSGGATVK
jgi:UDP-N-acetylmuramate--alanine ligase